MTLVALEGSDVVGLRADNPGPFTLSGTNSWIISRDPAWLVDPGPDLHEHVEALADLALDMAEAVSGLRDSRGDVLPLRIGVASGPVVAGVVGSRRFFYDVWGDAVNVAARMESTDSVGRIQVPEAVYQRLRDDFVLQERGALEVKGKGLMRTWYLVDRKPDTGSGGVHAEETQPVSV